MLLLQVPNSCRDVSNLGKALTYYKDWGRGG
jgi:hypothetical protein